MRSVLIAVGGALGAVARWGVGEAMPVTHGGFPWPTFIVNVTGAFLLGLLAIALIDRIARVRHLRSFLLIGLLGSYTTFSAMAVEGVALVDAGRPATAMLYWVSTMIVGLLAALVGGRVAKSI